MAAIENSPRAGFPAPDSPTAAKVQPRTEQPSAANVAKRYAGELECLSKWLSVLTCCVLMVLGCRVS